MSALTTRPEKLGILLVEDNPGDVRLLREGLRDSGDRYHLQVARDGLEAVDVLRQCGVSGVPLPDLILLDLNLPRRDGREVLLEIKQDAALRHIPVVVLTSSRDAVDISRVYELGANAYVTKPIDLVDYERIVRAIEQFWLRTVQLPPLPSA